MKDIKFYTNLLDESYQRRRGLDTSKKEFLSEEIFNFTTYDGFVSEILATKALEVCKAINRRTTFEYIKDEANYVSYILMCNTPFFSERIEWGCSIRGAWWDHDITLESCGLYENDEQLLKVDFTKEEWEQFIEALLKFGS